MQVLNMQQVQEVAGGDTTAGNIAMLVAGAWVSGVVGFAIGGPVGAVIGVGLDVAIGVGYELSK